MSWHYLPELVAGLSAGISAGSQPSAPWKSNRTAGKSSCGVRGTVCFPCSQSGTTCEPLTEDPGMASWMSSLLDSRANLSVSPESPSESTIQGTSGPRPSASYAKWDHDSHCWKTSQDFWPMTISAKSSGTWQRLGSMRSGMLFQRQKSELRTEGRGCGLSVPTPCARDWKNDILPHGNHSPGLARVIGGMLNPPWVEWLMGWPIGWTDLKPLEMARFQEWLRKHGIC